jgi:hypothetical protein
MDEIEAPNIEDIKNKLERLKTLDRNFTVFGACQHQYISFPLSRDEIADLESQIGVRLPEDYRIFLKEIGCGAGPYYGLYSPQDIVADLQEQHFCEVEHRLPDPNQPFPFTCEQAQECFQIMEEERPAYIGADWPTDGCIPICQEGCGYSTFLVTAGELTGSLWSHNPDWDDEDDLYLEVWNLVPKPPSILKLHQHPDDYWHKALSPFPTFLEWYNAWLDQCLSDFDELMNLNK